jgi:hypothetical protein
MKIRWEQKGGVAKARQAGLGRRGPSRYAIEIQRRYHHRNSDTPRHDSRRPDDI